MASNDPEHDAVATTEETPLLQNQSDIQQQTGDTNDQQGPKHLSFYAWRIFLLVAAVLVAVLFIKGWVDAGSDVDVSKKKNGFP